MLPSLCCINQRVGARCVSEPAQTVVLHQLPVKRKNLPVNLDTLEQLVDLIVAQLLSQAGQDISQLSSADKAIALLVEHLEAADELFWCSCWLEAVGAVEDVEERVVVDLLGCCVGEVGDFSLGRILA